MKDASTNADNEYVRLEYVPHICDVLKTHSLSTKTEITYPTSGLKIRCAHTSPMHYSLTIEQANPAMTAVIYMDLNKLLHWDMPPQSSNAAWVVLGEQKLSNLNSREVRSLLKAVAEITCAPPLQDKRPHDRINVPASIPIPLMTAQMRMDMKRD